MKTIIKQSLAKSYTYQEYRNQVSTLLKEGKSTGNEQSADLTHYSELNEVRMNRLDKTMVVPAENIKRLQEINSEMIWLVISEGWCGDAAQIVPVINKIVSEAPDQFKLKLTLRDKNLPLIDAHLTNGGRAIPVLLILDEAGNLLLPKWGPRPAVLQGLLAQWKTEGVEMPELAEKLHGWYAKDKTAATQQEINELLKQLL